MNMKRNKIQWGLMTAGLLILVLTAARLIKSWEDIPNKVVTRYTFIGAANRWGPKTGLIIQFAIGCVIYGFITYISYSGFKRNRGSSETFREEHKKVHIVLITMSELLKLLISIFFSYLVFMASKNENLFPGAIAIFLLSIFLTIVLSVVKCYGFVKKE